MKPSMPLALVLLLAAAVPAQLTSNVGPPQAPLGCSISINITNDTTTQFNTGICPYVVRDANLNTIFTPVCIAIIVPIPVGTVFTTAWNQIDDSGNQVPPGAYFIDVNLPNSATHTHSVLIGGVDAAMVTLGTIKVGTTRGVRLCSPQDPNRFFVALASATASTGIPTCGGLFPLDVDPLLQFSAMQPNPVFINFLGFLDGGGETNLLGIAMPNLPALVGGQFFMSFLAFDLTAPCPVATIAAPLSVVIQ